MPKSIDQLRYVVVEGPIGVGKTSLARKLAARGYRVMAPDLPGHGATQSPAAAPEAIADAIRRFDTIRFDPAKCHANARRFGRQAFVSQIQAYVQAHG